MNESWKETLKKENTMNKRRLAVCCLALLLPMSQCVLAGQGLAERDTLTEGFWGLNDSLGAHGIELGIGMTSVYQRNTKGGFSTNDRKGEFSGSYDVEATFDMMRLLGVEGTLFIHAEGGWTNSEGIDGQTVGSYFGTNADAGGNRSLDIVEVFYELPITDQLTLVAGKMDLTGFFDGNAYGNDETAQFLNGALVNNPTIPFTDYGLGVVAIYQLQDNWYLMAAAADAQADGRETGFNTTFHDEDYFFYIAETGVDMAFGSLAGTYRAGLWYDPQPKTHSDGVKEYRDDTGVYVTCDQILTKENNDPEDTQGLGMFARYGYAPSKTNDMDHFYSFGLQYQGLIEGRDDDVLGIGYARGYFSDGASATYPEDYESVVEAYYNANITPWLSVSPSVQYIVNPGGSDTTSDAVVAGLRTQITF
jgi:porin